MATKQFDPLSVSAYRVPKAGWMTIGMTSGKTNQYADVQFPPLEVPGPIQEVRLYVSWNNTTAGEGFKNETTHAAVRDTVTDSYPIGGDYSGTASVALSSDAYAATETWTTRIQGLASNAASTSKGYSQAVYVIVTYQDTTAPTAPMSVSCSPSPFENSITVSWSGAQAGVNNPITSYMLYYQLSNDGINWGSTFSIDTQSTNTAYTFNAASMGRGQYFRAYIATIGTTMNSGASPYSNSVRKNYAPNTPGKPAISAALIEPGTYIRLSFANPGDPDGNAAGWEAAMQDAAGNWYNGGQIMGSTYAGGTTIDIGTSGWARGSKWKFLIRGYDTYDVRGAWSAASDLVSIAQIPPNPTIAAPVNGASIYNTKPRILIRVGSDPDGQPQRVSVNIPGIGWVNSVDQPSYFSVKGWIPGGGTTICQLPDKSGALTVQVFVAKNITFTVSGIVSSILTIKQPVWTDPSLVVRETLVKAVHMNELKSIIGQIRSYYGLAPYAWREEIIAGTTGLANWMWHVADLRDAISTTISYVNGFDGSATAFDIPLPTWIIITHNSPKADAISQLRNAMETL